MSVKGTVPLSWMPRRKAMEFFDICDERGLPTGEVVERSVAHSKGILHRTAHVCIIKKVDARWQLQLQTRGKEKSD